MHTRRFLHGFFASALSVWLLSACQSFAPALLSDPASAEVLVTLTQAGGLEALHKQGLTPEPLVPERQIYRVALPGTLNDWQPRLERIPGLQLEEVKSWQVPDASPRALPDLAAGFRIQNFVPNDPLYTRQWNFPAIGMEQAWELTRTAGSVTVAVVDSGIDPDHPDLQGNLLPLEDVWDEEVGRDRLINRFTGDVLDFTGRDGNGHGTHVAGVIAAVLSNSDGVAGIAGGGVKLLPIKATSLAGTTNTVVLVAGIRRAIERGAQVINLSIGSASPDARVDSRSLRAVLDLAAERGITVVAAAGNESQRSRRRIAAVTEPAAYPDVIAVGAFNIDSNVANYSNGGPELDLLAPGGEGGSAGILSTWTSYPSYEYLQRNVRTLSYGMISGTSMAAPHVTAVAALLKAREPQLTPAQIRSRLVATATDMLTPGFDEDSGYGRLNAYHALLANADDSRF
ncbi:MAG: S8 family serine peptidase [Candidatus Sericytochromatia bacterium]